MKGWAKYVKDKGEYVGIENFGKSAPYKQIYDHFDINTEKVIQLARKLLKK